MTLPFVRHIIIDARQQSEAHILAIGWSFFVLIEEALFLKKGETEEDLDTKSVSGY